PITDRPPRLPAASVVAEQARQIHESPALRAQAQRQIDVLLVHEEALIEDLPWGERGALERLGPAEHERAAQRGHLLELPGRLRSLPPLAMSAVTPFSPPALKDPGRIDPAARAARSHVEPQQRSAQGADSRVLGPLHEIPCPGDEIRGEKG